MADLEADTVPDAAQPPQPSLSPSPWEVLIRNKDLFVLNGQMVLTALTIIYLGAHGSLRRPPSAAPRKLRDHEKRKTRRGEDGSFAEGFTASDAVMFPILAGTVLAGLYYLIKWLNDPTILNKILRSYLSAASLISLGKLMGDAAHLLTSLVFPNVWTDRTGRMFRFDSVKRRQLRLVGTEVDAGNWVVDNDAEPSPSPLYALFLLRLFPSSLQRHLWSLRVLLKEYWTVKIGLHGVGQKEFPITLNGIIGVSSAAMVAATYHVTGGSSAFSNLMGLGMSYGAFMFMSPTSFAIGTLVLGGLFVYDIIMVFYTPFMVTVATKIDAPIKLVFDHNAKSSLLGLGDIVIPGIFICLSLRFDLWRFYKKRITRVPTELTTTTGDEGSGLTTSHVEIKEMEIKAEYIDPQGRWGDWFWTSRLWGCSGPTTPGLRAASFPKTYFFASMVGYLVGMVLTISMLVIFNHGQPALLYLVPCVTGSVWLMGAIRGELRDMWEYTEDGSLDTKQAVVVVDGEGKVISTTAGGDDEGGKKPCSDKFPGLATESKDKDGVWVADRDKEKNKSEDGHDVFRFVISTPGLDDIEEEDI